MESGTRGAKMYMETEKDSTAKGPLLLARPLHNAMNSTAAAVVPERPIV